MPSDSTELRTLARDLSSLGPRVHQLGQAVVTKVARDIEADAKNLAPVDTGALRNSIGADIGDLTAVIGPTVDYAPFLEYGTSRMAPRAFLGPATDRHAPLFYAACAKLAEDAL